MECGAEHCVNEYRIQALEKQMEENSNDHKEFREWFSESNKDRIALNIKHDTIERKLDEIKMELVQLKEKPSKRWETVISAVISAIVGFVIAYMLNGGIQ